MGRAWCFGCAAIATCSANCVPFRRVHELCWLADVDSDTLHFAVSSSQHLASSDATHVFPAQCRLAWLL